MSGKVVVVVNFVSAMNKKLVVKSIQVEFVQSAMIGYKIEYTCDCKEDEDEDEDEDTEQRFDKTAHEKFSSLLTQESLKSQYTKRKIPLTSIRQIYVRKDVFVCV